MREEGPTLRSIGGLQIRTWVCRTSLHNAASVHGGCRWSSTSDLCHIGAL
ncbi:hypothetical protein HanRHA438_Chr00c47g0858101 [Helianthus annuus]|nr:hypothetical protein HanRHA438_Chr00c47g0858101 [Helianthus annuus]